MQDVKNCLKESRKDEQKKINATDVEEVYVR